MDALCRTALAVSALAAALSASVRAGPPVSMVTVPQGDELRSALSPATVSVSADGRFVAFLSYDRLARADSDARGDVYVLDRVSGAVTLLSDRAGDQPIDSDCGPPRISGDGRFVIFEATSPGLEGARGGTQIVRHDRADGSSRRISRTPAGGTPDGWSGGGAISADGQTIAFTSTATDLVAGADANGEGTDVYAFHAASGAIERVSLTRLGVQAAEGASFDPAISADGRYIAFTSTADLDEAAGQRRVVTAPNARRVSSVYVRDTVARTTARVGPAPSNGASMTPAISGDGRFVAFASFATNLVGDDRNRATDVFLYDRETRATTLVSRSRSGRPGNGASGGPAISADGARVAFHSNASDLACAAPCSTGDDINLLADVFLFERRTRTVVRLSAGVDAIWMEESHAPALDGSGEVVAFSSKHPIDEEDVRDDFDMFVRMER